jgi:hypothetical protein
VSDEPTIPKRFCNAFIGDDQCGKPATCICDDGFGTSWFACSEHGQLGYDHLGEIVAEVTPIEQWFRERVFPPAKEGT